MTLGMVTPARSQVFGDEGVQPLQCLGSRDPHRPSVDNPKVGAVIVADASRQDEFFEVTATWLDI